MGISRCLTIVSLRRLPEMKTNLKMLIRRPMSTKTAIKERFGATLALAHSGQH